MNHRKSVAVWCSLFVLLALAGGLVLGSRQAVQAADDSVFSRPRKAGELARLRQLITALFQQDNYVLAETYSHDAIKVAPDDPVSHYNLACAEARLGKTDTAIASLGKAIELGFRGSSLMKQDDDLASLRDHAEWKDLLSRADAPPIEAKSQNVTPGLIEENVALVDEANTVFNPATGLLHVFFRREAAEDVQPRKALPIATGTDEASKLLRQWQEEGTAAGLDNVLYDNHDRDHSNVKYAQFPQLTRIEYGDSAKAEQLDNGLQHLFRYNGIVFGNSSTAVVGSPIWRSLPRLAWADAGTATRLAAQYFGNHLYFYPEHKDYDPGHNGTGGGFGDVYPVNTPFVIISQGSSGSDRVFMEAIAKTLAAFRPEVQQKLASANILMPTVQMIFRRSNKQVQSDEDYLSGKAHPAVFQGNELDPVRMVRLAHDITAETAPPVALLKVVEEDQPVAGRDYFDIGPRGQLFTTPAAIARVGRSVQRSRRMVVSAEDSKDPNGRDLTFHWVVLQGDTSRIQITPQNEASSVVELTIQHHERFPVSAGSKMETNRVDIGAFVHNGQYYSAPAFISFYWPDNETRVYDDDGRVRSVEYSDPAKGGNYVDPLIVTPIAWQDDYHYDNGQLTGWTRRRGNKTEDFTADGALVLTRDRIKRPLTARTVHYVAQERKKQPPILEQRPGSEILHYEYSSPGDMTGHVAKRTVTE